MDEVFNWIKELNISTTQTLIIAAAVLAGTVLLIVVICACRKRLRQRKNEKVAIADAISNPIGIEDDEAVQQVDKVLESERAGLTAD